MKKDKVMTPSVCIIIHPLFPMWILCCDFLILRHDDYIIILLGI